MVECIWAFLEHGVLQEVDVVKHPELLVLQTIEEDAGLIDKTPQQLLLLWLNWHLHQSPDCLGLTVRNFDEDLRDGAALGHLLARLAPKSRLLDSLRLSSPGGLYGLPLHTRHFDD